MSSACKPSGFLVVLLLWGMGIGFAVVELTAASQGYNWSSTDYLPLTLATMTIGGGLGILLGLYFDRMLSDLETRRNLVFKLWALLIFGLIIFGFIEPLFQGFRE